MFYVYMLSVFTLSSLAICNSDLVLISYLNRVFSQPGMNEVFSGFSRIWIQPLCNPLEQQELLELFPLTLCFPTCPASEQHHNNTSSGASRLLVFIATKCKICWFKATMELGVCYKSNSIWFQAHSTETGKAFLNIHYSIASLQFLEIRKAGLTFHTVFSLFLRRGQIYRVLHSNIPAASDSLG